MRRIPIYFLAMTFVCGAKAQVSPSTMGIIDTETSQRSSQGSPTDMSSGRYRVKPKSLKKEKPLIEDYEKAQTPPKKEEVKAEVQTQKATMPAPENASTLIVEPIATPENGDDSGLLKRARDHVIGGSPDDLDGYRSFLPPDDPRRNLIDFYAAPIFIYNDSSSPYWFRNYTTFSPGFTTSADIWFTPLLGIEAGYRKSITGAVRNSPANEQFVSASHEWITAGLRFRRFFGYGENIPMLMIGLDYREYNFKVPSDDPNRVRLKTTSPRILIETTVPSTLRYSWKFNLEVTPFARHQEVGTGYELQSGTENESFGYGLGVGGEYKLARTSRMFFKLSYFLERNAFSGTANRTDPVSGTTPSSVPVSNSFTIFEFGYIWGQ
jgi:hypothetical protein